MIANITTQHIVLEDERVLLRPLEAADYDHLLPFALQEPEIWHYSLVSPAGAEGMQKYIDGALKARAEGTEYAFIVFDKQANAYAGCTRFYDIQLANSTAQLGYTWYGSAFQRTGLNRHCKLLLLEFSFEQWGLQRLEFRADANNQRSINAMKAIGCTVEGILRSNVPNQTGRRDSIILSILPHEWQDSVKTMLQGKTH